MNADDGDTPAPTRSRGVVRYYALAGVLYAGAALAAVSARTAPGPLDTALGLGALGLFLAGVTAAVRNQR